MLRHETITISGFKISYLLAGSPDLTKPVFYLHGFPGSRLETTITDKHGERRGVTLISYDRPGFGGSDLAYAKDFSIRNSPTIIKAIADNFGLSSFGILGVSGGAPYACAAAAGLPDQVTKLVLVSPLAPIRAENGSTNWLNGSSMNFFNKSLLRLAYSWPSAAAFLIKVLGNRWEKRPERVLRFFKIISSKIDKNDLEKSALATFAMNNFGEALRQGGEGPAMDLRRFSSNWGVDLASIKVPTEIWHGEDDTFVPIESANYLAKNILNASLEVIPNEGHYLALKIIPKTIARFGTPEP